MNISPYNYVKTVENSLRRRDLERIKKGKIINPVQLELQLTKGCLNDCGFCISHQVASQFKGSPLDERELFRLFEDIGIRIPQILLSGGVLRGEPLLSPRLSFVIERIKRNSAALGLYTVGGRLLTDDIAKQLSEQNHNGDYVALNYSSYDEESYQRIYRPRTKHTGHRIVLESIDRLANQRIKSAGRLKINVNYGLTEFSFDRTKTEEQIKSLKRNGVDNLKFIFFVEPFPERGAFSSAQMFMLKTAEEWSQEYSESSFRVIVKRSYVSAQKGFKKCAVHQFRAVIANNSRLAACVYNKDLFFGNLHEEGFWDAWYGLEHHKLLESLDVSKCPSCSIADNEINEYLDGLII